MAGALGLSLGGPRSYQGETIDLPRMGDGRPDPTPAILTLRYACKHRHRALFCFCGRNRRSDIP